MFLLLRLCEATRAVWIASNIFITCCWIDCIIAHPVVVITLISFGEGCMLEKEEGEITELAANILNPLLQCWQGHMLAAAKSTVDHNTTHACVWHTSTFYQDHIFPNNLLCQNDMLHSMIIWFTQCELVHADHLIAFISSLWFVQCLSRVCHWCVWSTVTCCSSLLVDLL